MYGRSKRQAYKKNIMHIKVVITQLVWQIHWLVVWQKCSRPNNLRSITKPKHDTTLQFLLNNSHYATSSQVSTSSSWHRQKLCKMLHKRTPNHLAVIYLHLPSLDKDFREEEIIYCLYSLVCNSEILYAMHFIYVCKKIEENTMDYIEMNQLSFIRHNNTPIRDELLFASSESFSRFACIQI